MQSYIYFDGFAEPLPHCKGLSICNTTNENFYLEINSELKKYIKTNNIKYYEYNFEFFFDETELLNNDYHRIRVLNDQIFDEKFEKCEFTIKNVSKNVNIDTDFYIKNVYSEYFFKKYISKIRLKKLESLFDF
jgi:hypothetical protein